MKDVEPGSHLKYDVMFTGDDSLMDVILQFDERNFLNNFIKKAGRPLDRRMLTLIDQRFIESVSVESTPRKYRSSNSEAIVVKLMAGISYSELTEWIIMNCGSSYGSLRSRDNTVNPYIMIKRHDGSIVKTRYPMVSNYASLISRINSEYIKKIDRIKGAEAVSLFGILGVNGVTVVELKPFEGGLSKVMPEFRTPEQHQIIRWRDRLTHYNVPQQDIRVSREHIGGVPEKVLRVKHTETETIITMGCSVYYDSNWLAPNSNQVLEDVESGDRYYFRRLGGNLPVNTILVFDGCKGQVVEVDYVFPRLADNVKEVTMYSHAKSSYLVPFNGVGDRSFKIKLADYVKKHTGRDIY